MDSVVAAARASALGVGVLLVASIGWVERARFTRAWGTGSGRKGGVMGLPSATPINWPSYAWERIATDSVSMPCSR